MNPSNSPGSSVPSPEPQKALRDMTDEEFAAARQQGATGQLTPGFNQPEFTLKGKPVNHWAAKRDAIIRRLSGGR